MQAFSENYGWIAIESAPFDKDVTLQVTDRRGEPYRLPILAGLQRPAGSARTREHCLQSRR